MLGYDAPDHRECLFEEEVEEIRPPAMVPGTIDRITGTDARSDFAEQMAHLTANTISHRAVWRLTYRNALVAHDGFATWRGGRRFNEGLLADAVWTSKTECDTLRFPIRSIGRTYFGHWLSDGVSSSLIDKDMAPLMLPDPVGAGPSRSFSARMRNVMSGTAAYSKRADTGRTTRWHTDDYREIFDIKSIPSPMVFAKELVAYDDHGQGQFKRDRYQAMRATLAKRYTRKASSPGVYIRRGTTGLTRDILNEDQICDALAMRGWTILNIATVTVEDLYYHLAGTRVVVGLDGSQLSHALFMLPQDGVFVMLMPPDRFTAVLLDCARAVGLKIGMVLLEGAQSKYEASLDAILETIDIAASDIAPQVV